MGLDRLLSGSSVTRPIGGVARSHQAKLRASRPRCDGQRVIEARQHGSPFQSLTRSPLLVLEIVDRAESNSSVMRSPTPAPFGLILLRLRPIASAQTGEKHSGWSDGKTDGYFCGLSSQRASPAWLGAARAHSLLQESRAEHHD